ncbi:centrosomal protein of 68 kDa isoform X2 [Archocentrus centrarchus]|uniref:centrosomal protein of 68 kDa isoform X2 n=1 Tax=Archocentrus centrarchus TaxID=63155 RepID=UPI0011EA317B|nr:centrosomal protein of 68 kDa isoform X2 [Archocentrus centrarchus]
METKGCSQRFKELQSRRCSTTEDSERSTSEGRGGPHKSVTMAATSSSVSHRQYVARKPLFSAEHHASILKKTHPQRITEEKQPGVDRSGHHSTNFWTKPRDEVTPLSLSLSLSDISLPSTSKEDLSSPLGVSELLSHHEESTTFGTSFPMTRLAPKNLSSSNLQVHRLNLPLKPRLTSTVLYPTSTPRSGFSKPNQTQVRLESRKERSWRERKLCSLGANTKEVPKSPYQANYWACAIPKALPPSPDRHSTGWDPNKEYQALLNYTYPLRPGQEVSECDSSKRLQGDFVLHTDFNLQDSGIALDHPCSSTSLSGLDTSVSATGQSKERSTLCPGQMSPERQSSTRSADETHSLLSLSLDCLDCSKDRGETNAFSTDGHDHQCRTLCSPTPSAFIHSASVLPRSMCGQVDEEFRPLPEQLEELQLLSREVREITAQLSRPGTANWNSLEPHTTSILSSITSAEKQGPKVEDEEGAEVKELQEDKQDRNERKQWSREQTAAVHRNSKSMNYHSEAWAGPAGGRLSPPSLREAEALVARLCGVSLIDSQKDSWEDEEQSDSLMQHIQVFCSQLQLLIQQLHVVSEKMELLTAPTVEMDSVKSSLAEYQSFQREVSRHQPLASCALHAGQLLLSCMNSTSPFLRDALLLIESQSGVLQTHSEHFFSSILSAMDNLTQPSQASPIQQSAEEDPVVL